ncbi:unnamed protein product [Phytophthora fragariaefolia]|uniref:Unnamed protein product n=1 Tax=Phytophthora fragariaefolia TaxID=1490495 RepID=A0A9W6XP64_9STRA|nr:unnamed protein product [Phytophthora fragariaefolia]
MRESLQGASHAGWMLMGVMRPPPKGFRSVNGCGEHNFVASALIDQARRKHRELRVIWYDLKTAVGSVLHDLLWYVLESLGVPSELVGRCQGIYDDAAFVDGNTQDGPSAPVSLRVCVFQGCPLSPHLFTAVITPLLLALDRLHAAGVKLSGDDRLGVCAFADDLNIFSTSKIGIDQHHKLVTYFLTWTRLEANPSKFRSLSATRNSRCNLVSQDLRVTLGCETIPSLTLHEAYTYLGIGDGFDHAMS